MPWPSQKVDCHLLFCSFEGIRSPNAPSALATQDENTSEYLLQLSAIPVIVHCSSGGQCFRYVAFSNVKNNTKYVFVLAFVSL